MSKLLPLPAACMTLLALGMTACADAGAPRVRLATNLGDIVVELDPAKAPATVENFLAYAQFQHYLDEKWPETSLRRGNAVIRASLYSRIVDALQGGETTARFRYWVKKTEFFLIDRTQPGVGYGACLCIPVVKSRSSTVKKAGSERHSTYKLVARLEDFVYIIGTYHNDQKGHHGIRRTYAMVCSMV